MNKGDRPFGGSASDHKSVLLPSLLCCRMVPIQPPHLLNILSLSCVCKIIIIFFSLTHKTQKVCVVITSMQSNNIYSIHASFYYLLRRVYDSKTITTDCHANHRSYKNHIYFLFDNQSRML